MLRLMQLRTTDDPDLGTCIAAQDLIDHLLWYEKRLMELGASNQTVGVLGQLVADVLLREALDA